MKAAPTPAPPLTRAQLAERDAYEERAAILEYDGGMSREQAERIAGRMHPGPWAPTPEQDALPWGERKR